MNTRRLLQRFLRYVKIDTTARMDAKTYPSSPGQLKLGRLLVRELKAMGIEDAQQDEFGIVLATVPATVAGPAPTIAFCSHMDTSPETTGKDVKPQVIRKYRGGDIVLPANPQQVIRVSENPELEKAIGHTLITTDGTTLAGRRRQGRPGHHHGSGRMAHGAPRNRPWAGPPLLYLRRRSRPRRGAHRHRPDRRGRSATRSTATAATRSTWRLFPPRPPRSPFEA